MRRDLFMSAEEAQAHGIVDTVADSFNWEDTLTTYDL
jgi:ATP-dependent protease ClpP protease subunit